MSNEHNRNIIDVNADDRPPGVGAVPSAPPGDLPEVGPFGEHWYGETVKSGAVTVAESPIEAAEADALVAASRAQRSAYDPERRPEDASTEKKCAKADEICKVQGRALVNEQPRLRTAQAAAAAAGCNGPPPKLPWWLTPSGIVALSFVFAISLHDLVAALGASDGASWVMGVLLGLALGSFLVLVQLHVVGLPGLQRGAFWGAVVVALGIAVMRGLAAADGQEIATGLALGAVEIGIMVILEKFGRAHRDRYTKWATHDAVIKDATTACSAREERIRKAESVIAERNVEVADRARRSSLPALEDIFLRAARAAVLKGISHNRGRLLGADE